MAITLLDNVDTNTVGSLFTWNGGPGQIFVKGDNFGGGNVIIELSDDNGTTFFPAKFDDGTDFIVTANGSFPVAGWGQAIFIRGTLQGSTSPSNVNLTIKQV